MSNLYVPLDVDYGTDPKVIRAGALAELVYIRSLALAKRLMSDGLIDPAHLPMLTLGVPGRAKVHVDTLCEVGLWLEVDGGWLISGWLKRNRTAVAVRAEREAQRRAGLLGNHRRWHSHNLVPDCPYCTGELRVPDSGGRSVYPTAPDPSPDPAPDRVPDRKGREGKTEGREREGKGREGKISAASSQPGSAEARQTPESSSGSNGSHPDEPTPIAVALLSVVGDLQGGAA